MGNTRIYWSEEEYERIAKHLLLAGVSPLSRGLSGRLIRAQRELFKEDRWRSAVSLRATATVSRVRDLMQKLSRSKPVEAAEAGVSEASPVQENHTLSEVIKSVPRGDHLSAMAAQMGKALAESVMNSALDHIEQEMPKRIRAAVANRRNSAEVIYHRRRSPFGLRKDSRVELERLFVGDRISPDGEV